MFGKTKQEKPTRAQVVAYKALVKSLDVFVLPVFNGLQSYCTAKAELANGIGKAAVRMHRAAKRITSGQFQDALETFNAKVLKNVAKSKRRSRSSQLSQLWAKVKRNPDVARAWAKDGNAALHERRIAHTKSRKATRGQLKRVVRAQGRVLSAYVKLCDRLMQALKATEARSVPGFVKRQAKAQKQVREVVRAAEKVLAR